MEYVRIVVKDNYEKRGDLVLRSYIRGLKKINANVLLSNSIMPGVEKAVDVVTAFRCPDQIGERVVVIGGGLSGCEIALECAAMGK